MELMWLSCLLQLCYDLRKINKCSDYNLEI